MISDLHNIFEHPPVIENERLILRTPVTEDAERIFSYASNPVVTKYLIWDTHKSIDDTLDFLSRAERSRKNYENLTFGIILKKTDQLIGMCGFHSINAIHRRAEIGYVLSSDCWGQGIMTDAVSLMLQFGFSKLNLNRIEARTRPENIASRRVLIKTGMNEEGVLRQQMFVKGRFQDYQLFSILKSEFNSL